MDNAVEETSLTFQRPGISGDTLVRAGIRHVNPEEAFNLCGLSASGIWIPYSDVQGKAIIVNGKEYGRLRLDNPRTNMKYYQPHGTGVHAYIPWPFYSGFKKESELNIGEGEFTSLSPVEAGYQVIGLPGLFPYTTSEDGTHELLPELQAVLNCLHPSMINFWGDSDTSVNWQFAASVHMFRKLLPADVKLQLPRIPLNGPKGIDDCREEYKDSFDSWWESRTEDAVQLDESTTVEDLVLTLLKREITHATSLTGEFRLKIEKHLASTCIRLENSPTAYSEFKGIMKKAGIVWGAFRKLVEKRRAEINGEIRRAQLEGFKEGSSRKESTAGSRPRILLPGNDRLISEFGNDLASALSGKDVFFNYNGMLVQISGIERKDAEGENHRIVGFLPVHPHGFIPDYEQYVETGALSKTNFIKESLSRSGSETLVKSNSFKNHFPVINGLSDIPLPYFEGGELKFANPGYNRNLGVYVLDDSIGIDPMGVDEALWHLTDMLGGFCFLDIVDFSRALAYLSTMLLRLVIGDSRTMIFLVDANRQGAGKDYLLGLASLIFTGQNPCFYPPCNNEEEWRKRIMSGLIGGERFILISNQKGHLDSGALEHTLTSPYVTDRILGKSENVTLPNTAIYGISGNDLTFSEDMARRICHIRLEFYAEDQKSRVFKYSDLYSHVLSNRPKILSALMSLIVHWASKGCPKGRNIPSFVRWSETVGGILTCCGLPDPFGDRTNITPALEIGGSREDKNIKLLLEQWHIRFAAGTVNAAQLRSIADEAGLFSWMNLSERSDQVKFSKMLTQRANREVGNWCLKVDTGSKTNKFFLEAIR